jgi:hypothetical protein
MVEGWDTMMADGHSIAAPVGPSLTATAAAATAAVVAVAVIAVVAVAVVAVAVVAVAESNQLCNRVPFVSATWSYLICTVARSRQRSTAPACSPPRSLHAWLRWWAAPVRRARATPRAAPSSHSLGPDNRRKCVPRLGSTANATKTPAIIRCMLRNRQCSHHARRYEKRISR